MTTQQPVRARRARGIPVALQRVERLTALHEAARVLGACRTESDLVALLAARMHALCGARIWVALYEPETDILDTRFRLHGGRRVPEWEARTSGNTGLGAAVARLGVTIATGDYVGECVRRGVEAAGPEGTAAQVNMPWVGVPLVGSGQVLGVLCASDREGEPFDAGMIEVLETLAAHASTALENIRLRADEVAQRADLEARSAALQESELRYRRLVDLSPDSIVVHVDGRVVYANVAARHLVGATSPEQLNGLRVLDMVHPDSRENVLRRVRELQSVDAHVPPAEERLVRFDGTPIEVEIDAAAVVYQGRPAIQVVMRDISQRKRTRQLLEHQALHDGLTGLPNRRLFGERLRQALEREDPPRRRVGIMFLDLDDFKIINDTLSHQHGDSMLQEVARRLEGCVRSGDTVARLGGDEFAVLLDDVPTLAQARRGAERVRRRLSKPIVVGERAITTRCSIGIAFNDRTVDPDLLLRNADLAMYEAKSGGKGRTVVFDAELEARLLLRLDLERELGGALERGELEVQYQPVYELATGSLVGAEALLRWHHPRWGLVAPDRFIPIAEQTGLIVPIGRWVIDQACAQAREWLDDGVADMRFEMSVNLSGCQLQHPHLTHDVQRALENAGLAAHQLVLEVTESTAMADVQVSLEVLRRLRALGVRLAIDDFGTGYSSLSHLKHFPIDILKIDRSFVSGPGADAQDEAIIRSVIALARSLQLSVIAEGIETADQYALLCSLGCEKGQGFLMGRPVPSNRFQLQALRAA
ncbi:MAG TPA: EAL domain-containing protein [Chloroflexota bacterium]|nr:EAL domain-containing protein [Chloroflexota bacterium]